MDYYYSQQDPRWADEMLGRSRLTMRRYGCVVTGCAIFLSYYWGKEILPGKLLQWLNDHDGFNADGEILWEKICEFANYQLRYSLSPNPKKGELTFGIRKVTWAGGHWVIDHPRLANKVIDTWDGVVKDYKHFRYTGRNRFFLGVPRIFPVDKRYHKPRTWTNFLLEQKMRFYWIPGTPAAYIYNKIHRRITDRETNALVYGRHDYSTVFENKIGDIWFYKTKMEL